jgi:hypothetical protein
VKLFDAETLDLIADIPTDSKVIGLEDVPGNRFAFSLWDKGEIWIAELGLVGELWRDKTGQANIFARGVTAYPSLGNRVRVASKAELGAAFCGEPSRSVRIGTNSQDTTLTAMKRVDQLRGKLKERG